MLVAANVNILYLFRTIVNTRCDNHRRVSVDDIAKAAGMAKGPFYNHFSNKEDLLMKMMIDRAPFGISLLKVFGFDNGEVRRRRC